MKMTQEAFAVLDAAVTPLDTGSVREAYRTGNFPRADRVHDLDKRYRWDLLWAARRDNPAVGEAISGLKDSHIDTALRAIVPALGVSL